MRKSDTTDELEKKQTFFSAPDLPARCVLAWNETGGNLATDRPPRQSLLLKN